MSKTTLIIALVVAFVAGYYFSAKIAASKIGDYFKPSA